MKRLAVALALLGVGILGVAVRTQTQPASQTHKIQQVAPGVYSLIGSGAIETRSSSAVLVNQDDVIVIDTHITPAAGRALIAAIRTITDKPVRYVVNTHHHFDHIDGNQVFTPMADIIGHQTARQLVLGDILHKGVANDQIAALPGQIEELRRRAAAESNPATKAQLQQRLAAQEGYAESLKELKPTPPNVTFTDHMSVFRGDREIQFHFLGRAHTNNDIVIYLPRERVIVTGDMFEGPVTGYLGEGWVNEWPQTLERLKAFDFDTVMPGHGEPFTGKERIDYFQAYLRDLWQQGQKLHDQRVPAAEAAKRIDLTAHKAHYAAITGPGVADVAVTRMYAVMDGHAEYLPGTR